MVSKVENRMQSNVGYIYAIFSSIITCTNVLLVKFIPHIPIFQTIFSRSIILLSINTTLMGYNNTPTVASSPKINKKLHIRGFLGIAGLSVWFVGISMVPMSEGVILMMTTPVMSGILAKLILGEPFETKQLVVSIFCLCGVVLIIKPDMLFSKDEAHTDKYKQYQHREIGAVLLLFSAFLIALVQVAIKELGASCHVMTIAQYNSLYGALFTPLLGLYEGVNHLRVIDGLALICLAVGTWIQQLANTRAYMFQKVARISTISYIQVVLSMLLDCFIFSFFPDGWTILGSLLISSSIITLLGASNKK